MGSIGRRKMIFEDEEVFFLDLPSSDNVLVYAPLRSYLAEVRSGFLDYIKTERGKTIFLNLLKAHPLIDINKIQNNYYRRTPSLSLAITDDCTLRCQYCYFRAGDTDKRTTMSKDHIRQYIDAYFRQIPCDSIKESDKSINIAIAAGGEPTKAFDNFKYAVEYIEACSKQHGYVAKFTMPTNGFYGDEVRQFIVDHFFQVSLSMDGPKDIQDTQRPTANGGSSFQTVYDTAKFFYEHNFKFAIRSTITNYSIHRMKEIIDFFHENFPNVVIGMERMSEFGRGLKTDIGAPTLSEFKEAISESYQYGYKKGALIKNASLGKSNSLRTSFCLSVAVPNWTVLTDGRITSCTRDSFPEQFTFGAFDEDSQSILIDEEKISKLRQMNVFHYKECETCFAKYNCAGDCPNLRFASLIDCDANRRLLLERLVYFLKNKKGVNLYGNE
ncbi:radical SAM protein [Bacteroides caecimuris]|uniref:radical SAM/SPASM domain-containing protein n=1 Tax=Bacteroides caecimuris TaxID=1796613 RepID=UPI00265B4F5E|nr:radical SAM protein [Bacteroides caecimuris]